MKNSTKTIKRSPLTLDQLVEKKMCEKDHLAFTRYFFKKRQNLKFLVNWHHVLIADAVQDVIDGKTENLLINVSPGSSKTEEVVINTIARGIALNPRARFMHLSASSELALLNSQTARDIINTEEYQTFWPLKVAEDSNAKARWNVVVDGKKAGGVYATSTGGQITGFRAGHMAPGFQGAILIDDPLKPEDAFSPLKIQVANRRLLSTIKSRKANPKTPIIVVMQRIAENDPAGFIIKGNMPGNWTCIKIPALINDEYVKTLAPKYRALIKKMLDEGVERDEQGRFSYWPYKEELSELLKMERGEGADENGKRMSRHVFSGQYQQEPVALGGNLIKGKEFIRYQKLPKIKYRKMYADTAQKTKEHNDYSVFALWGAGDDGRIYLLDLIRGKWEAPELKKRAIAFWMKHRNSASTDITLIGALREMQVEDKSSGTGLIQSLKLSPPDGANIPVKAVERNVDKLTRVMDVVTYIECGLVCIPEDAPFTQDFIAEHEAFSPDMSHDFDDQVDTTVDAIKDMLDSGSTLKLWESLGSNK